MFFNVSLTVPSSDINYPIGGVETIASAGKMYWIISVENDGFKYVSELDFGDTDNLSVSVNIENREFVLQLHLQNIQPYIAFTPVLLEDRFSFEIDENFVKFFGGGSPDNGGSPDSSGAFSVPDLDGNFGSYPNGTIVTVSGRSGQYTIEASQQLWAFPASEFQGSCVIYKLSQNGKILLAPHWMLTIVPKAL